MDRRHFLGSALALGTGWKAALAAGAAAPLRMAVHPYNSTLALLGTHRPLVQYLIRKLGAEIEFFTAPNFESFLDTLLAGGYDIVLCPPHYAVLAMRRDYMPLFHYRPSMEPILVVRKESALREAADFRGRRIAMADPNAFIRIVMVKWLEDHGLVAGRDYVIVEKPTHGAAVAAVTLGEADGGLTTTTNIRQAPADIQQQLFGLTPGIRMPHVVTMAHRRLGEAGIAALQEALAGLAGAPEGREFFGKMGVDGYVPFGPADVQALQPYVDIFLRMRPDIAARVK